MGWLCFSPVTSRVSPRRASYFLLLRQKKVTKKKASHVRAASRCLALLAAFGTLANSLRSNSASVLIRTLLRCSARPNGGGYHTARPLRGPRPNGLFAALTSRGLGCLIPLPSLLSRARHAVPLQLPPSFLRPHSSHRATTRVATTPIKDSGSTPTSSFRAQSRNPCSPALQLGCCDYAQHDGVCRATLPHHPHQSPSFLTPPSSLLRPPSSLLTPTTSLLPPTTSPLTPHSYDLTPHSYALTPPSSLLRPHSSLLRPHPSLLTPHPYDLTPPPSLPPAKNPPPRAAPLARLHCLPVRRLWRHHSLRFVRCVLCARPARCGCWSPSR